MRPLTIVHASVAFGAWGAGVTLSVLAYFASNGGCGTYSNVGGACSFDGIPPDLELLIGLALMVVAVALSQSLPPLRHRLPIVAPGVDEEPGVVLPIPGGLGVWVPQAQAPPVALARLPATRPRPAPTSHRSGPAGPTPGPRGSFSRYSEGSGKLLPLPGGLGIWVPSTYGPLRFRRPAAPPRTVPGEAPRGPSTRWASAKRSEAGEDPVEVQDLDDEGKGARQGGP